MLDARAREIEELRAKLERERERLDWCLENGIQVCGLAAVNHPVWIRTRDELDAVMAHRLPEHLLTEPKR